MPCSASTRSNPWPEGTRAHASYREGWVQGEAERQARRRCTDDIRQAPGGAAGPMAHNAADRALRGIALGRRAWLFAGSDRGGERAAAMFTLIGTAKLNNINPQAWLADVLGRINDQPASRLYELLPWHWNEPGHKAAIA
jgi:hypothetical protein